MDDRWRYEQFLQMLRKLQAQYDKHIKNYGRAPYTDEESEFNLDYPFDHILWLSVNGRAANKWWQDNFLRHADKIQHGVKKLAEILDGDAPIAIDRAHHAVTSIHQTRIGGKPPPASAGHMIDTSKAQSDRARKKENNCKRKASANIPQGGRPTQRQNGGTQTTKFHQAEGFEICQKYQTGKCTDVDANGPAGPHPHMQQMHESSVVSQGMVQ